MRYPFKALVAYSGSKEIDGIEYTEAELNGIGEDRTREFFDGHDRDGKPIMHNGQSIENTYRLLIVANKYLTGFDQPKLCAMYVDKKLQGVLAVLLTHSSNRVATVTDLSALRIEATHKTIGDVFSDA